MKERGDAGCANEGRMDVVKIVPWIMMAALVASMRRSLVFFDDTA